MCKMPIELENLYFFLILDSKDIKDKQLTVSFNLRRIDDSSHFVIFIVNS